MNRLNRPRLWIALLMLLVAGVTFALQSYNVGFWGERHGWTSSHSLSIIRRAVPENRFVGYSLAFREADGSLTYEYFDRYPVFFSAAMNGALSLVDDLPTQIYLSRQIMNGLLLLTMFVGYRLVRLYVANRFLAFGVTVLSFSSYYLLYYKDMPDFHPPVVLGFLALAYSVARYKLHGERVQVYLVGIAAVMLAFGYSVLFALAVWLAVDALHVLRDREGATVDGQVGRLLRLDALWVLVIGVVLSAGAIAYNVSAEAAIRGVPLAETSVVDSILRRIPFLETAVDSNARAQAATTGVTGWLQFLIVEFERIIKWSLPLQAGGPTGVRFVPGQDDMQVRWWIIYIGVPMTVTTLWWVQQQHGPRRDVAIITALPPLVFLFSMINLTSVHDFVTMYVVGFTLIMWTALLSWAARWRWLVGGIVVAAIALYTASSWLVRAEQQAELVHGAPYTYDFDRMRTAISGEDNTIYLDFRRHNAECVIRNWQCYALGYLLGNNYLSHYPDGADYILSPRPYYATETFLAPGDDFQLAWAPTRPDNEILYLMDMATAQPRTAPDADAITAHFGEQIVLQNWSLHGDVSLRPCERVFIESGWRAQAAPALNYNMQIVMVDGDGRRVTDFNAPLGAVATSLWEAGRYTVDARPINVPCDTLPGEYPLVMGVYNPDTLDPAPVAGADGAPLGNQLYLTTLFVE